MSLFLNAAPGRVYFPPGAFLTCAVVADKAYAIPFSTPPRGLRVDQIGFRQSTAGTATGAKLAIYRDANGSPGNLVIDAGAVAVSGTGGFAVDLSAMGDGRSYLELAPQRAYWLTVIANGTGTWAGHGVTAAGQNMQAALGAPSFATIPNSATTAYTSLTATQTYANGFPADGSTLTWTLVNATAPIIGLRAAPAV